MSTFAEIENSSNTIKYIFLVIIIIFIFFFLKLKIELNIIFGTMLAILLILYINHVNQQETIYQDKLDNFKRDAIIPKSDIISKNITLVNFLYSIQDFYVYNQPAYEEMIEHIEIFLQHYEHAKIANELAGKMYGLALSRKKHSLNNLHSIIYNLPSNKIITKKLNDALQNLDDILSQILEEIRVINKEYIILNGYNSSSVIINTGPKEANFYEKDYSSFDLF